MSDDKGFIYKVERFNLLSAKFLAFIVVLVVLGLLALNYLNIFSPSFLSSFPRKEVETTTIKSIGFASEVQGYTLGARGNNHKALIDSLDKLGVWSKKQSASGEKVSNILVLLAVGKADLVDFVDKDGKVLFSYSQLFSNGTIFVKLYIEEAVLQKDTAQEDVGKYLSFIFETLAEDESLSAETASILEEIKNNITLTKNEQLIRTNPSIVPSQTIESNSTQ